jgi:hypothetical protein
MKENNNKTEVKALSIGGVRRSSLSWWNKLTKSKQINYEMQMFGCVGCGEGWEDNSLHADDIVKMFQHYA